MNATSEGVTQHNQDPERETPDARFRRVATRRTRLILKYLRLLGNTSGQGYRHTKQETDAIFTAIRNGLAQAEGKFSPAEDHEFSL